MVRTGRPARIDRRGVAAAALELGAPTVTLPALAAHLGVHHSTLYGHVADRADVTVAVGELLADLAPWPRTAPDWRSLLLAYGETFWSLEVRHPGAAQLIRSLSAPPAAAVAEVGRLTDELVRLGLARDEALVALDLVADLALDTAASMAALDRAAQRRAWADTPAMVAAVSGSRGWYDRKLAIVLDGLAARAAQP